MHGMTDSACAAQKSRVGKTVTTWHKTNVKSGLELLYMWKYSTDGEKGGGPREIKRVVQSRRTPLQSARGPRGHDFGGEMGH